MKRKLKYFAIFLAIVFGFAGFAGILAKKNSQSTYAINSTSGNVYGSSDSDGLSLNGTDLVVTFTVDSNLQQPNDDLFHHAWYLYLYDASGECPSYDAESHLVTEELTYIRDEEVLDYNGYYSNIGYNSLTGTIQLTIDAYCAFYHSYNDFGVYFDDLLNAEHGWKVYIGSGYGDHSYIKTTFAVDLYVGTIGADGTIVSDTQEEELSITFRPVVEGDRVYVNQIPEEVVVKYYVTQNDGVNSFVLVPSYDKNVFTLLDSENNPRVEVNGIAPEAITVTGNVKNGNDPEFVKIAFDSSTLYDAAPAESNENVLLLTLTFTIHGATHNEDTYGRYRGFFGLVLDNAGKTNNTSSVAYQDLSGEELGNQEEVLINLDVDNPNEVAVPENVVDIYKRNVSTFEVYSNNVVSTYCKTAMPVTKVTNDYNTNLGYYGVQFKYNGNGNAVITWKEGETILPSAPQNVGTYTVTISIPATDTYTAVGPVTVTVTINPAEVTVRAENKTSAYAETPQQLTYKVTGLFTDDSLASQVTLTVYKNYGSEQQAEITLSRSTNAGEYTIVPNTTVSSNYTLTLTNGSYTVKKYETAIYVASWISPQTFNGGTKTAYAAPNVFICDEFTQTLPQEVLDLLGNYTLSYTVNFPETGVVNANDPENEYSYYEITPSIALANKDNFNFHILTGAYKIDPAQVRLVADDKSATFNGGTKANYAAPETYYVYAGSTTNPVSEALRTALGTVTLTVDFPAEDVVNARTYTITPHYTANNNLIVTPVNGTYTISPLALTTDEENAIKAAFGIVQVTYDAEEHTMYTFDASGLPLGLATNSSGYSVSATINGVEAEKKTDAGIYPVSITFTITDETINQNRNTTEQQYITIPVVVRNSNNEASKINPLPITIEAGSTSATFNGGTKTAYTDPTEYTINYTAQEGTISLKELASLGTVSLSVNFPTSGMVNATTYTITPVYTENGNYVVTTSNGTYTVNKANPVLEIDAMSTFYNDRLYIYSPKITVGNLVLNVNGSTHDPEENPYGFEYAIEIWKGNQKVLDDAWMSENYWLDAGDDYTAKLVLTGNDNYNSASASSNIFAIWKVYVDGPKTITYNGNTVTWSEVTKDVNGKDLHNSTVTYTISKIEYPYSETKCPERSFTATAKGTYRFTVTTSNPNYEATSFYLDPVYSVTFLEGTHTANPATPTNMPAVQYVFKDQKATRPETNPSLTGYTFAGWYCDTWEFNFNEYIINDGMVDEDGDCKITAQWNINYFTVTVSIRNENGEVVVTEYEAHYNQELAYIGPSTAPFGEYVMIGNNYPEYYNFTFPTKEDAEADEEYTADDYGKIFGFDTWMIDNTPKTSDELVSTKVTSDINVTIRYKVIGYTKFEVTYKLRIYGNTDYTAYATESVHKFEYTEDVDYETLAEKNWFARDTWYLDEERNIPAPATMPNKDITVYGAYVFDIGTGDVNGDGNVTADDITLYRQWIVGGYEMTVVEAGTEWETATASNFDANGKYYLARVADNNADTSKDIRDVSVTRMAIVGGYTWSIRTGLNVTGQEIKRDGRANSLSSLSESLQAGERVTLIDNITDSNALNLLDLDKNIYINLNGKTLTVSQLTLNVTGDNTITIENGTIVTTNGVTLIAPNGSVVLTSVTAYDKEGLIQLQAANHSLHFNGVVNFYKGVDTTAANPTPAAVKVEKGTHIVVEKEASVVVEKLVVTEQFVATVAADATITISNNSSVSTEIAVVGNYVNEIDTLDKLIEAGKNGGNYTLAANIETNGNKPIKFVKDTVLDLNGYSITSTNDVALRVLSGATLTLNGNGFVNAQEACVMAFGGSNVVINGGTYTSYDNFVIGTNGSAGNGGNTITINGGVFNGNIQSAGYVACGIYVANSDTVTVNAGTFNIENGVGVLARAGFTTIAEDVEFNVTGNGETGKVGDSRVVVPAGDIIVVDLFASKYPGLSEGFTLVNNTSYAVTGDVICNVNDLSTAMQNGGYYVLMNDFIYSGSLGFAYDTTLYLNGHTLQSVNNITLYATNGAKLTINGDGEVKGQEACVMAFTGSKVEINGGTYTCYDNFVIGTNGSTGYGNNLITINGGVFNGYIQSAGYIACGVYVANNDTVVINAGTFNITNGVGVLARSGNTTIAEGVVFNMLGDNTISGGVGDKSLNIQSGNEIVVDLTNPAYPGGTPTVENNTEYNVVNLEA